VGIRGCRGLAVHARPAWVRERPTQSRGGTVLRTVLASARRRKARGFVLGTAATAITQSSSAITAITMGLVAVDLVDFGSSLAVLLGANVGTIGTAWLVSFKLTGIGRYLLVMGAVLGELLVCTAVLGKPVFHLGFILFASISYPTPAARCAHTRWPWSCWR